MQPRGVDLLQDHRRGAQRQAGAAVFLGDQRAEEAGRGQFVDELGRIGLARPPARASSCRDSARRCGAPTVAQLGKVLAEFEHRGGIGHACPSCRAGAHAGEAVPPRQLPSGKRPRPGGHFAAAVACGARSAILPAQPRTARGPPMPDIAAALPDAPAAASPAAPGLFDRAIRRITTVWRDMAASVGGEDETSRWRRRCAPASPAAAARSARATAPPSWRETYLTLDEAGRNGLPAHPRRLRFRSRCGRRRLCRGAGGDRPGRARRRQGGAAPRAGTAAAAAADPVHLASRTGGSSWSICAPSC